MPEPTAAYLWTFACGHTTAGGNECADACPVCDEPDLVRKAPVESAATVYDEIKAERDRQDAKWGGPEHDDGHSWHLWIDCITEHALKAYSANNDAEAYRNARRRYIEVAALAVAAVESMDRTVMDDVGAPVEEDGFEVEREGRFW